MSSRQFWGLPRGSSFYDIACYITEHTNKPISGGSIIHAVSNVYKNAYSYTEEDLKTKMPIIIEENKKRQEQSFPRRYKINVDGSQELIANGTNKFDFTALSNGKTI